MHSTIFRAASVVKGRCWSIEVICIMTVSPSMFSGGTAVQDFWYFPDKEQDRCIPRNSFFMLPSFSAMAQIYSAPSASVSKSGLVFMK